MQRHPAAFAGKEELPYPADAAVRRFPPPAAGASFPQSWCPVLFGEVCCWGFGLGFWGFFGGEVGRGRIVPATVASPLAQALQLYSGWQKGRERHVFLFSPHLVGVMGSTGPGEFVQRGVSRGTCVCVWGEGKARGRISAGHIRLYGGAERVLSPV